jgi:hypothetical protein
MSLTPFLYTEDNINKSVFGLKCIVIGISHLEGLVARHII